MQQLTQKEQLYLKDAKKHEELCVAKYNHYSSAVSCPELRQILQYVGQQEVNHLQTVTQIIQGQIPQMGGSSSGSSQSYQGGQGGSISQQLNQMGQQHMGQQHMGQGGHPQGGNYGQSSYHQGGNYQGGNYGQSSNYGHSYTSPSGGGTTASQTQYTGHGTLNDEQMCNDLLTTEKAISDMYDHAVFESSNPQIRQALNHIQKEEQEHAYAIYQYMQKKGWYQ